MAFFLVILGLLLILVEFYLPGMIMGILGALSMITGMILFASQSSSLFATILFICSSMVALFLLIRFALWHIVRAKPENSIYSDSDQEGYYASSFDANAIGKNGVALTDLKPGGFVLIEGHKHAAISTSGYIDKGESIVVIRGEEQSLIITHFAQKE